MKYTPYGCRFLLPAARQVRLPLVGANGLEPPDYSAAVFVITEQGIVRYWGSISEMLGSVASITVLGDRLG